MVRIEQFEMAECLRLKVCENASDELFVLGGVGFEAVGYNVVDIFDKYDVGLDVVEVFYQCAVSGRPKEQCAVCISERRVVGVHGDGIGMLFLFGEGDVVFHIETRGIVVLSLGDERLKEVQMLVGDGEMDVHLAIAFCIECALYEMFFYGRAHTGGIAMEGQQSLG